MNVITPLVKKIVTWVAGTYGRASLMDRKNRAARVVEEALELFQSEGGTPEEADKIAKRTFSRPVGEPRQEAAGVQFTLLAYGYAANIDPVEACAEEVARVTAMPVEHFRAKQREKFAAGTDYAQPIPAPAEAR